MSPDHVAGGAADAEPSEPGHDSFHDDKDVRPYVETTSQRSQPRKWDGPTYYGRSQLKAAPFDVWIVGGYIFLAGLSGSSALVSTLAETVRGRRAASTGRRGRYLAMLAPTLGSLLLVWDLHTPQRFYNMFRIAKRTSPMSIGTWILTSFIPSSGLGALGQLAADLLPARPWLKTLARWGSRPSAVSGSGLSIYTASLLSATSTPFWAAAPRAMAVRFGSSSIASGCAGLALGERDSVAREALTLIGSVALAAELTAGAVQHEQLKAKGVGPALKTGWGVVEHYAVTGLGILAPLALYALARRTGDRRRAARLDDLASLAVLAGSALLRVSTLALGEDSAKRPEISFAFSQPRNLPRPRRGSRIGRRAASNGGGADRS